MAAIEIPGLDFLWGLGVGAVAGLLTVWLLSRGLGYLEMKWLGRGLSDGQAGKLWSERVRWLVAAGAGWMVWFAGLFLWAFFQGLDRWTEFLSGLCVLLFQGLVGLTLVWGALLFDRWLQVRTETLSGWGYPPGVRWWLGVVKVLIVVTVAWIVMGVWGVNWAAVLMPLMVLMVCVLLPTGLAFAWAGREVLMNHLALRFMGSQLEAGDEVKIGEVSGRVLAVRDGCVEVQTPEGVAVVPGAVLVRKGWIRAEDRQRV